MPKRATEADSAAGDCVSEEYRGRPREFSTMPGTDTFRVVGVRLDASLGATIYGNSRKNSRKKARILASFVEWQNADWRVPIERRRQEEEEERATHYRD